MVKATRKCAVQDCDRAQQKVDMCEKHYRRKLWATKPKCTVSDCSNSQRNRGLCVTHYRRYLLSRDLPPCSLDGCEDKSYSRGWCRKHYVRWQRHGDPSAVATPKVMSVEERFSTNVQWQGDCLIWTGSITGFGYGSLWNGATHVAAHRYAWEQVNGKAPKELMVDHMCYNKLCCNIDHLRLATMAQNQANRHGPDSQNKHSGVRNVHFDQSTGNWRVRIVKAGKEYNFGQFPSIDEAARVAIEKRQELFGEYAGLG